MVDLRPKMRQAGAATATGNAGESSLESAREMKKYTLLPERPKRDHNRWLGASGAAAKRKYLRRFVFF